MNDKDAAIRTRAIQVLQQVEADSSVREVVHTVEAQDDNPVIRNTSRNFWMFLREYSSLNVVLQLPLVSTV